MAELCQRVLDGLGMLAEWAVSEVVLIPNEKCDIRNCSCYGAVKLPEHGMKEVEMVLQKKAH